MFEAWNIVTGDMARRNNPMTKLVVNSTGSWIVGEHHRSILSAQKELDDLKQMVIDKQNADNAVKWFSKRIETINKYVREHGSIDIETYFNILANGKPKP